MRSKPQSNPFPGLRPFETDEEHLFFGREREIDELLRRLRITRFLLVAGSSGTGKSSLVRSGLIPALLSGFMLQAGSNWRIMVFRPGENPIGNLAAAMDSSDGLGSDGELASTNRVLLEATLLRSSLGIVQAVREARIPAQDNVLIVVDQFEELFRFRRSDRSANARDEAVAFFKLLLEATKQREVPIYIALTMRSDFLGDCIEFPELPEAINDGLYLIPRMTRDELRSAITGPVAVAGGAIAQRLVLRLLNELGDNQDQLPVLQHALMRTWDRWETHRQNDPSIDLADYEAIGTLRQALSIHAEEAFQEARLGGHEQITETIFKALTDTVSDPRGVRRACSIQELAAVCQAPAADVIKVIEIFRRAGRSFLTPYAGIPLGSRTIVDLSHESLMRCWTRLIAWTEEERNSAVTYIRIAQAASLWTASSSSLWIDPQLETALQWRLKSRPTAAWAQRYDSNFSLAMDFLDRSERHRQAERQKELDRRRKWKFAFCALGVFFVAAVIIALYASNQRSAAQKSRNQAETNLKQAQTNLQMAEKAVDESLSSAGAQQSQEAAGSPEIEDLRRQLQQKAQIFYQAFLSEAPNSEDASKDMAIAHLRLGDIDRLSPSKQDALNEYGQAIDEYNQAINMFEKLSTEHPANLDYRRYVGYCHNWIGETLRNWMESNQMPAQYSSADAKEEYDKAIAIQQQLHQEAPANRDYQQDLARSHYNRGALLDDLHVDPRPDYLQAIDLLNPLVGAPGSKPEQTANGSEPPPEQELARIYTNLGVYLEDKVQYAQAVQFHQKAIQIVTALRHKAPSNYEYKTEAANYYFNLACVLNDEHQLVQAKQASITARELFRELARPSRTVETLQEDNNKLRAEIDITSEAGSKPHAVKRAPSRHH